jgi:hypothetical protein
VCKVDACKSKTEEVCMLHEVDAAGHLLHQHKAYSYMQREAAGPGAQRSRTVSTGSMVM